VILDEFQKIIARVETATGRRFRPEQTVELYHQLSGFDGNTLNEAFNIYLSQEDPPKNLEWFIKNQCKEILFKNRSTAPRQFEDRQKVFEVSIFCLSSVVPKIESPGNSWYEGQRLYWF
jgi:beta-lactamase class D